MKNKKRGAPPSSARQAHEQKDIICKLLAVKYGKAFVAHEEIAVLSNFWFYQSLSKKVSDPFIAEKMREAYAVFAKLRDEALIANDTAFFERLALAIDYIFSQKILNQNQERFFMLLLGIQGLCVEKSWGVKMPEIGTAKTPKAINKRDAAGTKVPIKTKRGIAGTGISEKELAGYLDKHIPLGGDKFWEIRQIYRDLQMLGIKSHALEP